MKPDYERLFSENVKRFAKQGGMQAGGCCPFHEDRNPSFSMDLEEGLWICHAGCGEGNAYQFCEILFIDPNLYGLNGSGSKRSYYRRSTTRSKPSASTALLHPEADNYAKRCHSYLVKHWEKLAIDLPWCIETIAELLPGFDASKKSLVFSHFNSAGEVVCVRKHKLGHLEGKLNSRLYPVQKLSIYDQEKTLFFAAGEKDALALLSNGLQTISGTTGENSIPPELDLLQGFNEIVIVYDADDTGRNGAAKLAQALLRECNDTTVKVLSWPEDKPEGYDITDFFQEGGTTETLISLAKHASIVEASYILQPRRLPMTDAGQAELLAQLNRDRLRFIHRQKNWVTWNGYYWQVDDRRGVVKLAVEAARERLRRAVDIYDSDKQKEAVKFAFSCESEHRIKATLNLAQPLEPIATLPEQWDSHSHLLQFENGTYDLDTFELKPGDPGLMISQCTRIKFNPDAKCPRWLKFMDEIMQDREELVDFLQRAIGYSLTSDTTEQVFFMLYGSGANGKSVFLDVLRTFLGDYVTNSAFSAFERKKSSTNTNDLARLRGARLVTASESGESRRLDEECIKTLTGGDQVTVRFLYKEHFDFTPTFKLWLAVNTLPKVRDYSDGFWRRVLVVPFDAQFKGDDCDPTLINTLKSELPGIVNWAIEGFEKWCEKGLSLPDEVINATKSYQQESDIVAEFLSDCVLTSVDQEYSVPSAILFSEFLEWCSRQHQTCNMSRNAFTRQVGATSGTKVSKKSGVSVFIGFQLIAQER